MKSREKVLALLVKLQAMADATHSNSPEEAAIAAAQMQKLMFEHKISMAEVQMVEDEDPITKTDIMSQEGGTDVVSWRRDLLGSIAGTNFCRVVYQSARRERRGVGIYRGNFVDIHIAAQRGELWLYGRKGDTEKVRYLYQYLCREIDRLTKDASSRAPAAHKKRWSNSFRLGCVATIGRRLFEARRASEQGLNANGCALVKREDEAVRQFMRQDCPHITPGGRAEAADADGFASGRRAAETIRLEGGKRLGAPAPQLK